MSEWTRLALENAAMMCLGTQTSGNMPRNYLSGEAAKESKANSIS